MSYSTGAHHPFTAVNSGSGVSWTTPNNVFTSDNIRSNAVLTTATTNTSKTLIATNFQFDLPKSAFIVGVKAQIEKSFVTLNTGRIRDVLVQLVVNNNLVGDNKADLITDWNTSDTLTDYGGPTDLWNVGLFPKDVNTFTFGFAVSAKVFGGIGAQARIDWMNMTLYYTLNGYPLGGSVIL